MFIGFEFIHGKKIYDNIKKLRVVTAIELEHFEIGNHRN